MDQFDLSQYELQDTTTFTPKAANGVDELLGNDGKPVVFEVYSPGSPEGVKALHKSGRQAQMRMFRSMRGEFDPQDAVNADRESAEKLAAFTKSISSNFPVAALAIYTNPRLLYLNRQVDEVIGKTASFSKASSVVSP